RLLRPVRKSGQEMLEQATLFIHIYIYVYWRGLHLFEDVDTRHRAPPLAERTLPWALRGRVESTTTLFLMIVAAGPVSRILSAGLLRWDGHSSGPCIAARL